jgi:ABC-type phosphate/phosphonate transport system substrate-binding protein
MGWRGLVAVGILVSAASVLTTATWAQTEPDARTGVGFLICYPNAPGSPRAATRIMEGFGDYLTRHQAPCEPIYFNDEQAAVDWATEHRPPFGIVSLSVFLRWRVEHGLEVVALSERNGATTERFHLLVVSESPLHSLEDLAEQRLGRQAVMWSSHLEDPRFAEAVVFAGELPVVLEGEGPVRSVVTEQPLRALRRMKQGSDFQGQPVDAVLVDDTVWRALQELSSFQGVLRPIYSSPQLPTPPVVRFAGAPEAEHLVTALTGMKDDEQGRQLLETLQVTGWEGATSDDLRSVIEAYGEGE